MQTGISLVKQFEGCYLKAYYCPAHVLTIGFGHTGPDVHEGQTITREQADALLAQDYTKHEAAVKSMVVVPLTDNQLGALTCFVFNIGAGAFKSSTMLRLLNSWQYAAAADQFDRWTKGGGKVLPGLVKRRTAEKQLFLA